MEEITREVKFSGFIKSDHNNTKLIELKSITENNVETLKKFFKLLYESSNAGIGCKLYEVKRPVFITSYSAYSGQACKTVPNGKDPDKILFEGDLLSTELVCIKDLNDDEISIITSFFEEINEVEGYITDYSFFVNECHKHMPSTKIDNQED